MLLGHSEVDIDLENSSHVSEDRLNFALDTSLQ